MDEFDALDRILDYEAGPDYWYDYAIDLAHEQIKKLSPEDWEMLQKCWSEKDLQWQRHLAQVIGDGDPTIVLPILSKMVPSPDSELAEDALESL